MKAIPENAMKNLSLLAALLIFTLGTAVNAATYDFAAEGNALEMGYGTFVSGVDSASGLPSGLTITASNGGDFFSEITRVDYFAYMDGNWNEDAGLGVCQTDTNSCGSDDNQMDGEYIHMVFDSVVNILSLDITGDHTAVVDGAVFSYSLDLGATWNDINIAGHVIGGADLMVDWLTSTLDYTIKTGSSCGTGFPPPACPDAQMYLAAMTTATIPAVPVPSAFWLFGTALLGFISYSRRTKV